MKLLLEEGVVLPEVEDHKKTALIKGREEISYADLRENISSFAELTDILPGERVLICSENRPEWVYALYGAWQRGGVVVPVDFMSSVEEILYILKETEPAVVFCSEQTQKSVREALQESGVKPLLYNFDSLILPKAREKPISRGLEETALILYTSGTTGQPKGVMLSFKNLLSNIRAIQKVGVAGKRDKTLALLPFHHSCFQFIAYQEDWQSLNNQNFSVLHQLGVFFLCSPSPSRFQFLIHIYNCYIYYIILYYISTTMWLLLFARDSIHYMI